MWDKQMGGGECPPNFREEKMSKKKNETKITHKRGRLRRMRLTRAKEGEKRSDHLLQGQKGERTVRKEAVWLYDSLTVLAPLTQWAERGADLQE